MEEKVIERGQYYDAAEKAIEQMVQTLNEVETEPFTATVTFKFDFGNGELAELCAEVDTTGDDEQPAT